MPEIRTEGAAVCVPARPRPSWPHSRPAASTASDRKGPTPLLHRVTLCSYSRSHQQNTNTILHAGRLFATVENAPPFEMDQVTLESIDSWNYVGRMLGSSTQCPIRTLTAEPAR